jgi:hypothetical protein
MQAQVGKARDGCCRTNLLASIGKSISLFIDDRQYVEYASLVALLS